MARWRWMLPKWEKRLIWPRKGPIVIANEIEGSDASCFGGNDVTMEDVEE